MKRSLKVKLMVIIGVLICVLYALSGVLTYNRTKTLLLEELLESAQYGAKLNAELVNNWVREVTGNLVELAELPDLQSMDWERQLAILEAISTTNRDFETLYVIEPSGLARDKAGEIGSLADRDYFQQVMETGNVVYSNVLRSKATNQLVVTVACPIRSPQSFRPVGVLAATVPLEYLQQVASNMTLNGNGHGWIVDSSRVTLAYPDPQYLGSDRIIREGNAELLAVVERIIAGEHGVAEYELHGVNRIMAFAPVELTNWSVAQMADSNDVLLPVRSVLQLNIRISIIAIFAGLLAAYFVAGTIVRPIQKIQPLAEAIAVGDLTKTIEVTTQDEIGVVAKTLNHAIVELRSLIAKISETSDVVASSSQELSASSNQVGQASQQVADTVTELAKGSDEQAKVVTTVSHTVADMSASIRHVAQSAQRVAKDAKAAEEVSEQGQDLIEQAIQQMQAIDGATTETARAINALGEISEQIGQIVEAITSIADQTNLLALNAAIEAARAGEQGRGFAVVAEEVRKLAEQSREAAEQISTLIQNTQSGTAKAIQAMEIGNQQVVVGADVVNKAGEAFDAIIKAVRTAVAQIQEVSAASEQLSDGTDDVMKAVENLAATAEEAAAGAEEISASAEEQNASVEEIAAAAESLAEIAQEMQAEIRTVQL